MSQRGVPLTVIGGYLGAGKTTLVNHLLRAEHGLRLAVVVNDFGDIAIDADLVDRRSAATITLANGCICCSLMDGLTSALTELRRRAADLDHVVVEASGVADPARIGHAARPFGFDLEGIVVLADAEQVRARAADKYVGQTIITQLVGADLIVLTKRDLVAAEHVNEVRRWLHGVVATPTIDAIDGDAAAAVVLGHFGRNHDEPSRHLHPTDYDTHSVITQHSIGRADLEALVRDLPEGVLRVKGFVHLTDDHLHRYVLQVVGRRTRLTPDGEWEGPPVTRLVFLGVPGSLERDRLDSAFEGP